MYNLPIMFCFRNKQKTMMTIRIVRIQKQRLRNVMLVVSGDWLVSLFDGKKCNGLLPWFDTVGVGCICIAHIL